MQQRPETTRKERLRISAHGEPRIDDAGAAWARSLFRALLCLVVILSATSCRTTSATVQQGLAYGFRTPEQAFASWRTAVQADLLAEEYACFSRGWRRAKGLRSRSAYAAARDEVLGTVPYLRFAISRAKKPLRIGPGTGDAVVLQSRIPGPLWVRDRYLVLQMVRENSFELFDRVDPVIAVASGTLDADPFTTGHLEYDQRRDELRAVIHHFEEETEGIAPETITDFRVGFGWKIEDFQVLDKPLELPGG